MPLIVQNVNPRIILGLMTFGPSSEDGARITDLDTFNKALDLFQTRGYSEVDTARIYVGGKQEAFTKETRWKERGLTLATKVQYPFAPGDNTADKVIASVETSLKDLGTDCVDVSVFWYLMLQMANFLKARKKLTIMGAVPDPISTQARSWHAVPRDARSYG